MARGGFTSKDWAALATKMEEQGNRTTVSPLQIVQGDEQRPLPSQVMQQPHHLLKKLGLLQLDGHG